MTIELADGRKNHKSKFVTVEGYKRSRNVVGHKRRYPNLSEQCNYHTFIPAHLNDGVNGVWVRDDHLDTLSENDWDTLMDAVADHQPGISELAKGGRERRKEKKDFKLQKQKDKNARKNSRRSAKDESKKIRANAKKTRADAKQDKANNGGESDNDKASNIFDTVVDKASGAYKKFKGGGDNGGGDDGGEESGGGSSSKGSEDKIFGLPKPIAIGGGIVIGLGVVALIMKSRKAA